MEDSEDSDSDTWFICKYCKKNWKGKKALNAHKKEKHFEQIRAKVTGQKEYSRPVINTYHNNNSRPAKRRKVESSAVDSDSDTSSSGDGKEYTKLSVNKIFLPSNKISMTSLVSTSTSISSAASSSTTLPNCLSPKSPKVSTVPVLGCTSNSIQKLNSDYTTSTISQKQPHQPTTGTNEENLITQSSSPTKKTIPVPLETTTNIDTTSDNNNSNNNNEEEEDKNKNNNSNDDDLEIVYECNSNTSRGTTPLPQQQFDSLSINKNIIPSSPSPSTSSSVTTTKLNTNINLKDVKIPPVPSSPVDKSHSKQQQQHQAHYKMKDGNLETIVEFEPNVQKEILSVLSNRPNLDIFSTTPQNPVSSFHDNLEQYQKQKLLKKQQNQNIKKTKFNSQNYTNNNNSNNPMDNFNPVISSTYSVLDINTNESIASITPVSNVTKEIQRVLDHDPSLKITRISSSVPNDNNTNNNDIQNNIIITGNDQNSKKSSITMSLGELINKATMDILLSDSKGSSSSSCQLKNDVIVDSSIKNNEHDKPSPCVKETVKTYLGIKNTHQRNDYTFTTATSTAGTTTTSDPQNPYSLNRDSTKRRVTKISHEKDSSSSNTFKCYCQRVFTSKGGLRRHQTQTHKLPPSVHSNRNLKNKTNKNNNPSIWDKLLDDTNTDINTSISSSSNNNNNKNSKNNNPSIWDKLLDHTNSAINTSNANINDSTAFNRSHQVTSTVSSHTPISPQESLLTVNNKTSMEYTNNHHQVGHTNKNLSPSSTTTTTSTTISATIPVGQNLSSSKINLSSKKVEPCTDIPKNYQCLICQAYFVTEAGMARHLKSHQNITLKMAYGCSTCSMRFPTEEQRDIHITENHLNQVVPRSSISMIERRSRDKLLDGRGGENGKSYPTSTITNSNINNSKQVDVIEIDDETTTTTGKHSLSSSESKEKDKQSQSSNNTDSVILNRCYICAERFDSLQVLNRHIFTAHTSNVQSQKPSNNSGLIEKKTEDGKKFSQNCNTCGIGFPNSTALKMHWKLQGHK